MPDGADDPGGDPAAPSTTPVTPDPMRVAPGDAPVVADTSPERRLRREERRDLFREAAIQAEYATGRHEASEEDARRGVLRRMGTIVLGFVVLIAGLIMMALPGPGVLTVIAGLAILARELPWAERLLQYVKTRAKIDELKQQPVWVQAVMWTFTAAAVIASFVYFTFLR